MADTGIKIAGTAENVTGAGTAAWSNPSNATIDSENEWAEVTVPKGTGSTNYLQGTNFSFNIPSGSTIDGVKAYIYKRAQIVSGAPRVADATIQLIVGGSRVGDNKANPTPDWDSTEDVYEYGGENDLWGLILSDSDVNASNFGIAIRAVNTYTAAPISLQARVYHIKMQVFYTPPSGNPGAMFMLFSVKDRIREIIEASRPKLWLPEPTTV